MVKDIYIASITSEKSNYGIFLRGFPDTPITRVHIANCSFANADKGYLFENDRRMYLKSVLVNEHPVYFEELLGKH